MAERHTRAVQYYSSIKDREVRHVLEVIALDIGHDDSPAHTSNRKIARRARLAVGTTRERIKSAIDSGELLAVKDGKYWFYNLNPEFIPCGRTSESAENAQKTTGKQLATSNDIETLYQRLCQNQETLYQRLCQNIVSIVPSVQTENGTEDRKGLEKGEDIRVPQLSQHFQTESGLMPSAHSYAVDWEPVFENWLNAYGDKTPHLITRAVKFARGDNENGKQYTLTSPRSLVNIIANMSQNQNGQVTKAENGGMYV